MLLFRVDRPAPTITLERPLHSVLNPSTRDIVTIAFEMPEYTAVGEGLTTCIRVYQQSARNSSRIEVRGRSGAP